MAVLGVHPIVWKTFHLDSLCPGAPVTMLEMKRKLQILAAGETFILKAAERVPDESLPVTPVEVALELVVAVQKLIPSAGSTPFSYDWQTPKCHRREVRDRGKL